MNNDTTERRLDDKRGKVQAHFGQEIKVANLNGLMRDAFPQKLERDDRGRLIDPVTKERVRYVIHVDMTHGQSKMQIHTPGTTYKTRDGKEYLVMPSGAIRRV
jgi:hypothetical protein